MNDDLWIIRIGEQEYRAPSIETVREWVESGRVPKTAFVFDPRMARWAPVSEVPDFADAVRRREAFAKVPGSHQAATAGSVSPGCRQGCFGVLGVIAAFAIIAVFIDAFSSSDSGESSPSSDTNQTRRESTSLPSNTSAAPRSESASSSSESRTSEPQLSPPEPVVAAKGRFSYHTANPPALRMKGAPLFGSRSDVTVCFEYITAETLDTTGFTEGVSAAACENMAHTIVPAGAGLTIVETFGSPEYVVFVKIEEGPARGKKGYLHEAWITPSPW